jgi:hypothetical protein
VAFALSVDMIRTRVKSEIKKIHGGREGEVGNEGGMIAR